MADDSLAAKIAREVADPTTPTKRLAEIVELLKEPWKLGPTGWQAVRGQAPALYDGLRRNPNTPRAFLFTTVVGYPEVVLSNPIVSLYLMEGLTPEETAQVEKGLTRLVEDCVYRSELLAFVLDWSRKNRCLGKTKRLQAIIERDSRSSEEEVIRFVAERRFGSTSLGARAGVVLILNEWRKHQPDSLREGKEWTPLPVLDVVAAIAGST